MCMTCHVYCDARLVPYLVRMPHTACPPVSVTPLTLPLWPRSRSTVPAAASAAAGLVHGQAITQQEHQHLAPAGPYDAAAAEAATAAGAGPAGTWPSAPTAGPAPYGTIYPEIKPYEYDKQQQQPYGFGQGQPQTYEGAIVPAAAGAAGGAAGAAAAGAAKTHQLVARLSTHAVLAARSVGETLIDGAYGAAYRIRRGVRAYVGLLAVLNAAFACANIMDLHSRAYQYEVLQDMEVPRLFLSIESLHSTPRHTRLTLPPCQPPAGGEVVLLTLTSSCSCPRAPACRRTR